MKSLQRFNDKRLRIFLELGTNIGDRTENLREALQRIKNLGLDLVRLSSIYETEPVGYANQNWFLNQVAEVAFTPALSLSINEDAKSLIENCLQKDLELGLKMLAGQLLRALLDIENQMGRKREITNGPRIIDIDLLLYGDFIITAVLPSQKTDGEEDVQQTIIIPHPRMHLRRFVLAPMNEIAPNVCHPTMQKTFAEMLAALDDESIVRVYQS
jgi:2-amino-4-hydroxy-6-hydroxymethyldihydropteridine diphosphokinase